MPRADLANVVEKVIDEAIRTFDPEEPTSFERWDDALLRLVTLLSEEPSHPENEDLLATVQSHRITLAFEIKRFDLVLDQSSQFVSRFPAEHPSFSNVAILRIRALHIVGDHGTEIQEALAMAQQPEIKGSEYVHLLADLSKRHPGCIPSDEKLYQKLQQSIEDLRTRGYDALPLAVTDPRMLEELAGVTADELRRANSERGEALLNELS